MSNNEKWAFAFDNAPLAQTLIDKLADLKILPEVAMTNMAGNTDVSFIKDFFTADGYPKLDGVDLANTAYPYIFPVSAPWYDGASIPAATLEMDPKYRQTACEAALSWLSNLVNTQVSSANSLSFHGVAFQEEIDGVIHTFAFPDTRLANANCSNSGDYSNAVVLIADSYHNEDDWAKQGSVPLYARQQAMFQLWCWEQFAQKSGYKGYVPTAAYIVRICGNLPTDCSIRTVTYDRKEAQALVKRICKARNLEATKGCYWKRNVESPQAWSEKLENEAWHCDDEELYKLTVQYMKARSDRKANERELKKVTDRMDAIAVELASRIPTGHLQGQLTLPDGTICTIAHNRSRGSVPSISPEWVRSFFPHQENCILTTSQERKTVTIDVC